MAGAREIQKQDHPQLFNIVEEMSIAAQLPKMPRVFIVDDPAPNAFAVGRNPDKAAVAVTIGLLKILNRDELQGVIAHEIGHIKNRDVALMTTAGIMLGAIVMLADIGTRAMWFGGGSRRSRDNNGGGGGAQAILMLVALVFIILSPILAQFIYFALSRRREYLADASGAMYTRWPEGLASALEKLGSHARPQADQSQVTAPMYIVRPLRQGERRSVTSAFSTHPPLEERIRVLRGMGGSADFAAYDRAFAQITGKHVVGARTLGGGRANGGPTARRRPGSADASRAAAGRIQRLSGRCRVRPRRMRQLRRRPQSSRPAPWPRAGLPPLPRTAFERSDSPDFIFTLTTPSSVVVSVFMPERWKILSMPLFSGSTSAWNSVMPSCLPISIRRWNR